MSTQALEIRPPNALAVTSDQLTLAKRTVAAGLNDSEFALYIYNCERQGIHPLDGLLVPMVRTVNNERKLTFVTTVDLLRSRAADSGEYAGSEDAIFAYVEGVQHPDSATVSVYRLVQGQRCMFTATARWDEYYPGEKQGFMWRSKPHVMLSKCAEGLALRKAFPKQLAGLYTEEELQRPDHVEPEKSRPEPVKKTTVRPPAEPSATTAAAPVSSESPQAQPPAGEGVQGDVISEKQLKMLFAIMKSAGTDEEKLKQWLAAKGVTTRKEIPKAMFQDVINWIDPEFKFHTRPQSEEPF